MIRAKSAPAARSIACVSPHSFQNGLASPQPTSPSSVLIRTSTLAAARISITAILNGSLSGMSAWKRSMLVIRMGGEYSRIVGFVCSDDGRMRAARRGGDCLNEIAQLRRSPQLVNVGEFYIDRAGVYDLLLSAADGR